MKSLAGLLFEKELEIKENNLMKRYENIMNVVSEIKASIATAESLEDCDGIKARIDALVSDINKDTAFIDTIPQKEYDALKGLGLIR